MQPVSSLLGGKADILFQIEQDLDHLDSVTQQIFGYVAIQSCRADMLVSH